MTTNAHQFVYLLSERGEHRADGIVSTLDRNRLPGLLAENWPLHRSAEDALGKLLGFQDSDLAQRVGHQLTPGKASVQLHVIPLA